MFKPVHLELTIQGPPEMLESERVVGLLLKVLLVLLATESAVNQQIHHQLHLQQSNVIMLRHSLGGHFFYISVSR